MNQYALCNIFGMTDREILAAMAVVEKDVKSELKEVWMCPDRKTIYVYVGSGFPCVAVPYAFAPEPQQCQ